jgi:hypothetical protein
VVTLGTHVSVSRTHIVLFTWAFGRELRLGCRGGPEADLLGVRMGVCVCVVWPGGCVQLIVRTMAKYDSFFVDVMMVEELGLQVPDPQEDLIKEGESVLHVMPHKGPRAPMEDEAPASRCRHTPSCIIAGRSNARPLTMCARACVHDVTWAQASSCSSPSRASARSRCSGEAHSPFMNTTPSLVSQSCIHHRRRP